MATNSTSTYQRTWGPTRPTGSVPLYAAQPYLDVALSRDFTTYILTKYQRPNLRSSRETHTDNPRPWRLTPGGPCHTVLHNQEVRGLSYSTRYLKTLIHLRGVHGATTRLHRPRPTDPGTLRLAPAASEVAHYSNSKTRRVRAIAKQIGTPIQDFLIRATQS